MGKILASTAGMDGLSRVSAGGPVRFRCDVSLAQKYRLGNQRRQHNAVPSPAPGQAGAQHVAPLQELRFINFSCGTDILAR